MEIHLSMAICLLFLGCQAAVAVLVCIILQFLCSWLNPLICTWFDQVFLVS